MAKSRSFSIFLLKENYNPSNCLKDDHSLIQFTNVALPCEGKIFVYDVPPKQPWWKSYWNISLDLLQSQKGAIVFLKIEEYWFALTFGSTYHYLIDTSYVYDFGIITTLNALDSHSIKSADLLLPETAKRQRIQSPILRELSFFDLSDETILKKLTGAVKQEYKQLFRNITGGANLNISSNEPPEGLVGLLRQLMEIYKKEDYKESFPSLQNIIPIKDPLTAEKLDEKLLEAFNQNPAPMALVLAVPDIIDYENDVIFKYQGAGRSGLVFNDVYIKGYRDYLKERDITEINDVEIFKKHSLIVCDENGHRKKVFSIYKSFLFDCELGENTYHLCDGNWYLIQKDFIQKMRASLDTYFVESHNFLKNCTHKREDQYSNSIAQNNGNVICLDKTNTSPRGQSRIEPCDLVILNNDILELAHIKISTRSLGLSHLFNQGANSIHIIRVDTNAKQKFIELLAKKGKSNWARYLDDLNKIKVIFGIITNKEQVKSDGLPIFSRISLLRTINSLKAMGIAAEIHYIKDEVDRKNLNPKEE